MLVTNNTKVAQLRCFLSNLLHWCVQMSASTRPFRGTSAAVLSNHPEHWSLHFTCSSSDLMWHHRRAQTLVKFDLCSFSLSAVEGGLQPLQPPPPSSLQSGLPKWVSLLPPPPAPQLPRKPSVRVWGNVWYCWGLVAGGEMLSNQTCYWGVWEPPPPPPRGEERERERAQLWQTVLFCYGDV